MADQNEPGTVQIGTMSGGGMRRKGAPETLIPPVEEAMPKAMTVEERIANFKKNLFPKWQSETLSRYDLKGVREIVARNFKDHATTSDELRKLSLTGLLTRQGYVEVFYKLGGGTFLHWAVRMEDIKMVKRILAAEAVDVHAKDEWWGATALHWAIRLGNMPIIEALLSKFAKDTIEKIIDRWWLNAGVYALLCGSTTNIPMLRKVIPVCNISSSKVQGEIERILGAYLDAEAQSRLDLLRDNWYKEFGLGRFPNSLHWAVTMEDMGMVAHILEVGKVDINAKNRFSSTAFHKAVMSRNMDIVQEMTTKYSSFGKLDVNCVDYYGYTALHWAVLSGERENMEMVRELLKLEGIRLFEESESGVTPLQIAHERNFRDIQKALMEKEPVRRYVDDLYRDRQVYVDAANAILVGAALIASVTFASWLQPPMGYIDPGYAKVQHNRGLQAFWVFNSLSFYFAIATVVFGARSVLPRGAYFIKRTVVKLRKNLLATAVLLACSRFCVIIAFGIAGSIVLKPEVEFQMCMIVPTVFGGLVCITSLALLCKSMWEDSLGRASVANNKYGWSNHRTWFLKGDYIS